MFSSILKNQRAMKFNILVMRTFVKLRQIISSHQKIEKKLKEFENTINEHDEQIIQIMKVIHQLIAPPEKPKKKMGFKIE